MTHVSRDVVVDQLRIVTVFIVHRNVLNQTHVYLSLRDL